MAKGSTPPPSTGNVRKLSDVSIESNLKKAGWRVERLKSGLKAFEINGDRVIEAAKIEQLDMLVRKQIADDQGALPDAPEAGVTMDARPTPRKGRVSQPRLEGVADPVIEELNEQADIVRDKKIALDLAKTEHSNEAEILKGLMNKHSMKGIRHGSWTHTLKDTQVLESKPPED
jgi:hypothetical protein